MSKTGAEASPILEGLFPTRVNVGEETFFSNIEAAVKRDLPWLQQLPPHERKAVIVAGGPSLADCERQLKLMKAQGYVVFALNNTASWLLKRGIVPDYHVLLDAKSSTARFLIDAPAQCLIASQCAPEVFDQARNVTLWHPNVEGIQRFIGDRECALIGGGTTVGLQAMSIAFALGFRSLTLVGFDSCYRGGEGHAYPQAENEGEPVEWVLFAGRTFLCARWMIHQVEEFRSVLKQLTELDCEVRVMGDGYLQETVREMLKTTLTAVYDLAVSPPTYDFLTFLGEAEKARIAGGHTNLDVVFMPGPAHGFRDDGLPPSLPEREGMLHRVCVSACRLLPSVRNVTVRKERQPVEGNIFPSGWTVLTPKAHYGSRYFKNALPCLRATNGARAAIAKRFKNYVTITVRQAPYWPQRNSNMQAWEAVAKVIEKRGYRVVWVRDTDSDLDAIAWDIDLRMALYEGAVCNLSVANGPAALFYFCKAPHLVFKQIVPSCPSTTVSFLAKHGISVGDQFGCNGKQVYADDSVGNILREFDRFVPEHAAA